MPTLVSPGVSVSVTDESFYASSGPGTVPLMFIATRSYKLIPGTTSPTAYAPGTLPENAGELYLITSQRELVQTFGEPEFISEQGTSLHGHELNEYGLWAAYSYLGIANRVYIIRADLDLLSMTAAPFEPRGLPLNGTYWFSLQDSQFGVFRSTGANNAPNASSILDFRQGNVELVDYAFKSERMVLGRILFSSTDRSILPLNTKVFINDITVDLTSGMTLEEVVNAINDAEINDIEAFIWYSYKGLRLGIRNISGGKLDFRGEYATEDSNTVNNHLSIFAQTFGIFAEEDSESDLVPHNEYFDSGDFAFNSTNTANRIYEKLVPVNEYGYPLDNAPAQWYLVGSNEWREAIPTQVAGNTTTPNLVNGDKLIIEMETNDGVFSATVNFTSTLNNIQTIADQIENNTTIKENNDKCEIEIKRTAAGYLLIINKDGGYIRISGSAASKLGLNTDPVTNPSAQGRYVYFDTHVNIPDNTRAGSVWIKTSEPNNGADWKVKIFNDSILQWIEIDAPLYADDETANGPTAYGSSPAPGVLYVQYDPSKSGLAEHMIKRWDGSRWNPLSYEASQAAPTTQATNGTLWYNDQFEVDVMVGDGTRWLGLNNHPWYQKADIILNGSKPTQKPLGSLNGSALVENDIWIDTSDLENYPKMYRYRAQTRKWEIIDNSDQTTPFGIVFADARWDDGTGAQTTAAFANSNYVDPDAPNPLTYPAGTLLFNTRFSTGNVKEWKADHFDDYTEVGLLSNDITPPVYEVGLAQFEPISDENKGRWVTASGNQHNGAPWMMRQSQRQMVVRAMAKEVVANQDIRSEFVYFNLLAAPGYVELLDEMVTLNVDKKEWATIIADVPARVTPDGTSIQNWATNAENAPSNGDKGLTTGYTYAALYYPWGLSTNLDGMEIMVPASALALRTLAYNDSVAYPWMAPAGFNRGMITNAANVGYLTSEDEFRPVKVSEGQRDVMYLNKINPIAFMPGRGLTVWGQKTLHPVASALDRVNVVRLINYLRYRFDIIAKPFLFEPNDKITRDAAETTFAGFLSGLIALRALYDFAVQCNEGNNTPERIDRNELWIDVAIKPVKAIEFIFVPIRVLNTGDELPS